MRWLIPFEKFSGLYWTYDSLIVWYLGLLLSFAFSMILGAIACNEASNKATYIAMFITGCCGALFFWWFTWCLVGQPIWNVAEKLNQRV